MIIGDRVLSRWKFIQEALAHWAAVSLPRVGQAGLADSLHPSSLHLPSSISPLPRSLLHHSWSMLSVAPLRTKVRKPQPHTAVCVCSYSGDPRVLYCFVISSTSSLLLSANCCFCSTFPWDHTQSNSVVETCATCLSSDLSVTVTLTANANYPVCFLLLTQKDTGDKYGDGNVIDKSCWICQLATCMMF